MCVQTISGCRAEPRPGMGDMTAPERIRTLFQKYFRDVPRPYLGNGGWVERAVIPSFVEPAQINIRTRESRKKSSPRFSDRLPDRGHRRVQFRLVHDPVVGPQRAVQVHAHQHPPPLEQQVLHSRDVLARVHRAPPGGPAGAGRIARKDSRKHGLVKPGRALSPIDRSPSGCKNPGT